MATSKAITLKQDAKIELVSHDDAEIREEDEIIVVVIVGGSIGVHRGPINYDWAY